MADVIERTRKGHYTIDDYEMRPGPLRTWCWIMTKKPARKGYVQLTVGDRQLMAHRVSYERHYGAIPESLTLDHLCRTPCCINPLHLEPVTRGENVLRGVGLSAQNARKTHCKRGHSLADAYIGANGARRCRVCIKAQNARRAA